MAELFQFTEVEHKFLLESLQTLMQGQAAVMSHLSKQDDDMTALKVSVDDLKKAFPSGDIEGHRRYHQGVIEWLEIRNRLVRDILLTAAKAGGVAGVGWVCYALFTAIRVTLLK